MASDLEVLTLITTASHLSANCPSKEPELVREVEWYQLDMVGLTSTHNTDSGTKLLERNWPLSFSGVAQGVRRWVGVRIFPSPLLSAAALEFSPVNEGVTSM